MHKHQDYQPARDSRGQVAVEFVAGRVVPMMEPVGLPYDAIYVQNRETGEVTLQSPKFVTLQDFAEGKYRVLTDDSGERLYNQQRAERLYVHDGTPLADQIADLEEEAVLPVGIGEQEQADGSDAGSGRTPDDSSLLSSGDLSETDAGADGNASAAQSQGGRSRTARN